MVLSSMYTSFSNVADNIENWRSLSKNDLINSYLDHEDDERLKESYIAAIFCRYWNSINTYYRKSKGSVNVQDCFEWLTHAILYALDHRKWKDPKSSLYNDPYGPDKALNICIASTRRIFYQSANNYNRKINFGVDSIQRLQEDNLSNLIPCDISFESDPETNIFINDIISYNFKNEKYIQALIIDGIINGNVFDFEDNRYVFSRKKLSKHLRNINHEYISYLVKHYSLDISLLMKNIDIIKNMLNTKLYKIIDTTLVYISKIIKETYSL